MRANGAYVAIVSGGFRQFTGAIRERLGADEDRANMLVIEGGKLTGKVIEPILGQDAKLDALKEIAAAMGLALDDTLAVGDGANDLPMLQAAGLGVAYRAKPKVAAGARRARRAHRSLPRCSMRRALRARISSRGERTLQVRAASPFDSSLPLQDLDQPEPFAIKLHVRRKFAPPSEIRRVRSRANRRASDRLRPRHGRRPRRPPRSAAV